MLTLTKKTEAGLLTFVLEGRLDTTTAPRLEKELAAALPGVTRLVLDLQALEYISSAGLRVLLSTQKQMVRQQGQMVVRHASPAVTEIFEITGFSDILTLEA